MENRFIGAGCSQVQVWMVNGSRVFPGDYLIMMPNGIVTVSTEDEFIAMYEWDGDE